MMNRRKVKEVLALGEIGDEIFVKGWVRTRRGSKNVSFIALNDGSTIHSLQIVADTARFDDNLIREINTGASISAKGILAESGGAGKK